MDTVHDRFTWDWLTAVAFKLVGGARRTMVMVRLADPVPPALVAEIVATVAPPVVGVPEIMPVPEFTINGVGRLLAL